MRQQRVQRRPLKRATRRDLDRGTPAPLAPRVRRDAGAGAAEELLARIDHLLAS